MVSGGVRRGALPAIWDVVLESMAGEGRGEDVPSMGMLRGTAKGLVRDAGAVLMSGGLGGDAGAVLMGGGLGGDAGAVLMSGGLGGDADAVLMSGGLGRGWAGVVICFVLFLP